MRLLLEESRKTSSAAPSVRWLSLTMSLPPTFRSRMNHTKTPPPSPPVVFSVTVQPRSVMPDVLSTKTPPPLSLALLPEIVQFSITKSLWAAWMAPPVTPSLPVRLMPEILEGVLRLLAENIPTPPALTEDTLCETLAVPSPTRVNDSWK